MNNCLRFIPFVKLKMILSSIIHIKKAMLVLSFFPETVVLAGRGFQKCN